MTDCIIHPNRPNIYGYVRFMRNGKYIAAHRDAWIKANGPIPDDLCVLHKCDVRNCVNPEHLFLGTKGDNNRDRAAKGRTSRKLQKLTMEDAEWIRMLSPQISLRRLAAIFGVTHRVILRIKKEESYT